jgi:hypothetical protein
MANLSSGKGGIFLGGIWLPTVIYKAGADIFEDSSSQEQQHDQRQAKFARLEPDDATIAGATEVDKGAPSLFLSMTSVAFLNSFSRFIPSFSFYPFFSFFPLFPPFFCFLASFSFLRSLSG